MLRNAFSTLISRHIRCESTVLICGANVYLHKLHFKSWLKACKKSFSALPRYLVFILVYAWQHERAVFTILSHQSRLLYTYQMKYDMSWIIRVERRELIIHAMLPHDPHHDTHSHTDTHTHKLAKQTSELTSPIPFKHSSEHWYNYLDTNSHLSYTMHS